MTALASVKTQFVTLFDNPLHWNLPEALVGVGVLGVVAAFFIRSRRAGASHLLQPDALWREPKTPEQLIGRDAELGLLLNQLANPLVFLISESGCGKSALLQAGVAMHPAATARFLPLYIDMSAQDWSDGLLRTLRDTFTRALPDGDPARGQLTTASMPEDYAAVFSDFEKRTTRRVLLLLDQFDDFQAQPRYRERFCPPDTRVWRRADAITVGNAFWRVLRVGLDAEALHIVVAVRAEATPGLESIRLVPDPPPFDLPRLPSDLADRIIANLTERPPEEPQVIANPQGGWLALRARLARDLQERGLILPQQLKVVLGGLRGLPVLSPAAYGKAGGLAALEAIFVATALAKAAQASALSVATLLAMLLRLVDSTRVPPDKLPPSSSADLAAGLCDPAALERALALLGRDEIVRRWGSSEDGTAAWQLDHAYLAQPILRLHRDRDRWSQLLTERARAHADAGWRRFWQTLLPLTDQVSLIHARLLGRIRYRGHRTYAALSLIRTLPGLAILGVVLAAGWTMFQWDRARNIESALASIQWSDDGFTEITARALAQLADANQLVRWRVETDVFSETNHAQWFNRQPLEILRALTGLDRTYRDALLRDHVTAPALREPDLEIQSAVGHIVRELVAPDLPPERIASLRQTFLATLATRGEADLVAAANGLQQLAPALTVDDPQAGAVLTRLR